MPKRDPKKSPPSKRAPERRIEVEWTGQDSVSLYSNFAEIQSSPVDLRIRLGELMEAGQGRFVVKEVGRVFMSPVHAKLVAHLLLHHITEYEKKFGAIPTPSTE